MGSERDARALRTGPLSPDPSSARTARHRLVEFLGDRLSGDQVALAALLLTEVASNALEHAGTPFTVSAELTSSRLRVEVADGSGDEPVIQSPAANQIGGRGMLLVNRLADRWGSQRTPGGKLVWFELSVGGGRAV